jgi:ubiquinone/menaquinone biosynthesis C-methylase UbiE
MQSPAAYWEPLWSSGRRYLGLSEAETGLLSEQLGAGRGRAALDIGCGDGALARHLHHQLGYRTTGIDCAPSAVDLATEHDIEDGPSGPVWRLMDFTTDDLSELPAPAYAAVTCRLVYRWVNDKHGFLDRVRRVLAPGGVFWVVTELADRRERTDPLQRLGITARDVELLTAGWSVAREADLGHLRCYALRP